MAPRRTREKTMHTKTRRLTARTITDRQIESFRIAAGEAGDHEAVRICDRALARRGGRGEVADMLNSAAAMLG